MPRSRVRLKNETEKRGIKIINKREREKEKKSGCESERRGRDRGVRGLVCKNEKGRERERDVQR